MKIHIMTRTTTYGNGECYTWAAAFRNKKDARRLLTKELLDFVAGQADGAFSVNPVMACVRAYRRGAAEETHDAILELGGATFYGDVFGDIVA